MRYATNAVRLVLFVAAAAMLCCCGGEDGKGPESPMPEDGSTDSWRNPTYHGPLIFGVAGSAEFNGVEFFHAWTFTLTGEARVGVWVNPQADNMDTVMYLYRREPGETWWGRYIARNDDYEGAMWSRLDEDLGAGEYRVMVKGYKQSLRGRFTLEGSCEGPGCADEPECGEMEGMPRQTDVAPSCIQKMQAVLTADAESSNAMYVTEEDRCSLPYIPRLAWDYYYSYWDGIYGDIEDMMYGEEIGFDADWVSFGDAGWLVGMDMGGDEDYMRFLFDGEGNLLVYYQSNQSPDVGWFCQDDGEATDPNLWPGEFCVGHYLRTMTKVEGEHTSSGSVVISTASEMLPALAAYGVVHYQQAESLSDEDTVNYEYTQWAGSDDGILIDLTLSATGHQEVRYMLGGDSWDRYLYYQQTEAGSEFSCESLR